MIRGSVVPECDDTLLLEAFSKFAQVKDIRMIKDKNTGELRDFAFVEFFTLQDAAHVIACTQKDPLVFHGQTVHVTYSKVKRGELPTVSSLDYNAENVGRGTVL